MSKPQIHKLPITPPSEPDNQPKKRRKQRPKVTKLHKEVWEEVAEQINEEKSPRQQRKELGREFGQFLHEKTNDFFSTCLGELVLMCFTCLLIAGLVALILKIMGEI